MTNLKKLTEFGRWYAEQPKVERKRLIREFEQAGFSRSRVMNWRTSQITPKNIEAIEKVVDIVGIEAKQLFPY